MPRTTTQAVCRPRPWIALLALLLLGLAPVGAQAGFVEEHAAALAFFPGADRIGAPEGEPPAAPVYRGDELVGYLFETLRSAPIPAYSGKPMNLLVGMDTDGTITGVEVLHHEEPILLVGIPEQALADFAAQYIGKSVSDRIKVGGGKREGEITVDAVTGATVTVIVADRTIMRAARRTAAARGIGPAGAGPGAAEPARVRMDYFEEADWEVLLGNGAVRRMLISLDDVNEAFSGTRAAGRPQTEAVCAPTPGGGERCDVFVDLYYAYLNAPTVGRNLLGAAQYQWLMGELQPGEHAIAVMGNGVYSFKGSGYVRGGIFDRIQLAQGERTVNFRDRDHHRLDDLFAEGAPHFDEMSIFIVRAQEALDPGAPWQLSLLVSRATGPLDSVFTTFTTEYIVPEAYVDRPAPAAAPLADDEPMWVAVWRDRTWQIALLGAGLVVLTLIMFLQDWLVRFPRLIARLRTGFLIYTVVVIGWWMLGQLSVVNVLTFTNSIITGFSWDTFLIDPVMFLLWSFVAVTLLLWGRGVFCGWLCPYGALQKLINQAARALNVRQWNLPAIVHDRLWAIKYVILLILFGISLESMSTAERFAEVEPFKTAVTLRFDRQWPFVLYAAGLLAVSAFNCKFYCKYLCPLGAALAVGGRLRLFEWLRRRKECGKPCQICARECEIQAIQDTGEINVNECHFCLDCQVTYWDNHKCPPLVDKRKRREKATRGRAAGQAAKADLGSIPVEVGSVARTGEGRTASTKPQ